MSNTDAQLCAASPLSILTCVLFAAAITKGLNIVMEIKLGFFVALFCWCWISAVSQHLHLHSLCVSEVEGAAGLNATALCGTHNLAAEKGRAGGSGNSTDHQPSLEEVTELNFGFVCWSQCLRILQ